MLKITDKCPEPMRQYLALHENNARKAAVSLGMATTSSSQLGKLADGTIAFTPHWQERIDRALKGLPPLPVMQGGSRGKPAKANGAAHDAPATVAKPAMLPKTTHGGRQLTIPLDDFPPLVTRLIRKHGTLTGASLACGYTPNWLHGFASSSKHPKEFTAEARRIVKRALAGLPPEKEPKPSPSKPAPGPPESFDISEATDAADAGTLGLAIVFCNAEALGALYSAGEAMGGKWVYKRQMAKQWVAILKIKGRELNAFRAVAQVIANDVVTP
jgi:hypothetical protein